MIQATRNFTPFGPAHFSLPRWAFVAWAVYCRQTDAGPRPTLAPTAGDGIEARRRARLLRDLVPQD